MAAFEYLDFDLLIERTGDRYRARVLSSPGGEASADFTLPFSSEQLQIFVLKAISLGTRRRVRRIESPDMREIKTFGRELFEAVFDDEVNNCLRLSLHEAEKSRAGLRIRLRLDDSDGGTGVALSDGGTRVALSDGGTRVALSDVPWEFMYDSGGTGFLCLSSASPVVRYQDLRQSIERIAVKPPLRLLVMISAPRDAPQLDVGHEQAKLDEALHDSIEKGLITIDRMEEATLQQLQRRLRTSEYHAFHFIGHGGYDDRGQGGVLLLEDEQGRSDPVSAEFLRTLFQNHRTLRLAVLNACEGARTDPTDPFAGVAQSLVRGGVAAVIAMQFEISDEAAIILSSEFYSALADGYPVDAALAEARTAVYTRASAVEWAIPVLYLRSPDASIFDVEVPPPLPPIRREEPPKPKPPSTEGPRPSRGRRAILASAAALTLILVTLFAVTSLLDGDEPPPPGSTSTSTSTSSPQFPVSSPLEGEVLFVHEGDIMAIDPNTLERHMVKRGDAHHFAPSVSRDGTRVVFAAFVDGSTDEDDLDVYRIDADGSGLKNLTESPKVDGAPAWSPDGTRIVFETKRDGNSEIYVMDADGGHLKNLTQDSGQDKLPEWSPEGNQIVFESDRDGDADIWIMDGNGDNAQPLTSTDSDDGAPVWSPEGDQILYRSDDLGYGYEAWVMNVDGSEKEPLTDEPKDVRAPAWSPDGRQIVFASNRDGDYDLYVVDVDGGDPQAITFLQGNERGPLWCCFPPPSG